MIWFSSLRKPFYAVVHARARIGNNFKRPALPGAIQFQSLLLPFQIDFLVVTGYAGISDCLALNVVFLRETGQAAASPDHINC